jgi:hypothetical protein
MRFGGLLEYDTQGVVRTVRAIVEHQTMDMVEFGEPETLMSQDVDRWGFITILYILHIPLLNIDSPYACELCRLHAGERWIPVRSVTERAAGAQFLTFILPYEKLESRRFPKFGSFAYIFRGMQIMSILIPLHGSGSLIRFLLTDPDDPADPRDRYFPLLGEL